MRRINRVLPQRKIGLERLLDAEVVANHLAVDVRTLRKYVDTGDLAAIRLPGSGHLRFRPDVVRRFVADAETGNKAA